jgi:hypothetical protein
MSTGGETRPSRSTELSPITLGIASLASVVATIVVSRFGLAGTVTGAALTPVVVALVRELQRPAARVSRLPGSTRAVVSRRLERVRWPVVAGTAAAAFAVAVAAFSVPDLLAGDSVVSDRPTTFFSSGDDGSGGGGGTTAPQTTTAPEETTAPETTTAPEATTAPETTTAPEATTAPGVPTAPPAATAPAPPIPPATTAPPAVPPATAPRSPGG